MNIIVSKEDKDYINECLESGEVLKEDLRRWFKEKWVDVSRKVKGKHPPCGRKDAEVASSYDKKEKKAMTSQKRRAEKKDPKVGKGNKPTMTKFDESMEKRTIIQISEDQFERLFEYNEQTPVLIYEDEDGSVQNTNFEYNLGLLNEAEYQGRKVQLGKIMQGDIKKFKVYVKNDKGKVVKVNYGY